MSTDDINEALNKVTPQKAAFLVEAWLVHQAIPDVSTLKFIAAIIGLDFEIVRYWFYCRSNRDGIKRAFAQSAAEGSDAGIVLPLLEEYYLLDKFSDDIGWDYRGPNSEYQGDELEQELELEQEQEQELEHEQESASNSSSTVPQPTRHKQPPPKQQQRRNSSITTPPSGLIKTLKLDTCKQPPSSTDNRRRKPIRRRYRTIESSDEEEQDGEQADDSEDIETLGTRLRAYPRASLGPPKPSRPRKAVVQGADGEPPRKRGRPLGSTKKKVNRQRISTKDQPPAASTTLTMPQQLSAVPVPTPDHPQSIDSPQSSGTLRYLTPVILLPAPAVSPSVGSTTDIILQETTLNIHLSNHKPIDDSSEARDIANGDTNDIRLVEKAASSCSVPKSGLMGDPVAGQESRKKFLELHQSVEAQQRRERIRARSIATSKSRSSKGSAIASPRAKTVSKKRKVVTMSGDDDCDQNDDENEGAKGENDNGTMAQDPPSSLKSHGDVRKAERVKGPSMGNPPAFFKEYGALIAKRREKQPVQEQPPESITNLEMVQQSPISGAVPQQYQSPTAIAMVPIERTVQYPLHPKPTTPTLPAQAHSGEPKLQHHPHNNSPSHIGQYSGSRYDNYSSTAVHVDQQAFEQERIASQQRDKERRKEELERHRDYDDEQRCKEHRGSDTYRTDRGPSESEEHRDKSRERSRERARSGSRKRSHRRNRSESREPLYRRSGPRGRSTNPRPLKLRQQTIHAAAIVSKTPIHRKDDMKNSSTYADETLSPRLQTQHRFSYDDSRSPYSPEAFDPSSLASAPFPPYESLPHVTSSPRQPQLAQSKGHYPLDDRRHSSGTNDPRTSWNTHHERRHVLQVTSPVLASTPMDMSKEPTAPATFNSSGDGNGNESCDNGNLTDAHERPRESSPTEFYSPRPINMTLTHSSLLQPAAFSPSRPSDQPQHFSTFVIPHPDFRPHDQPQSDTTQHLDSWAARPETLNRTAGGRNLRYLRGDDEGGENRSTHPSSLRNRSKSQHSNSKRRPTEEHQGSNGERGHRDRGRRNHGSDFYSQHGLGENHNYNRGDHDVRNSIGHHRQSHPRIGGHDHHRGYDTVEYEVDTFRRSGDNSRRHRDKSLRARSSGRPSLSSASQLGFDHGREFSRRRQDDSRDRRDLRGSSSHGPNMRGDKHEELEAEHTMSVWEKRREQERE